MVKQKFDLTHDMITIPSDSEYEAVSAVPKAVKERITPEQDKISYTIRISPSLKKELKMWCLINNRNISEATTEALKLLISQK